MVTIPQSSTFDHDLSCKLDGILTRFKVFLAAVVISSTLVYIEVVTVKLAVYGACLVQTSTFFIGQSIKAEGGNLNFSSLGI